jgi:hypothetical protein
MDPATYSPKLETKVEHPASSEPKCKLCGGTGLIVDMDALGNRGCEAGGIKRLCLQCKGSGKGTYAVK